MGESTIFTQRLAGDFTLCSTLSTYFFAFGITSSSQGSNVGKIPKKLKISLSLKSPSFFEVFENIRHFNI
jgi:hypothetical protein